MPPAVYSSRAVGRVPSDRPRTKAHTAPPFRAAKARPPATPRAGRPRAVRPPHAREAPPPPRRRAGGGAPPRASTAVLVAGSKGKGSTAAMLAAILQAAGARVGRYTQPHLVSYRERVWVDGAFI